MSIDTHDSRRAGEVSAPTAQTGETTVLDREPIVGEASPQGGAAAGGLLILAGIGVLLYNLGWLASAASTVRDALDALRPPGLGPNWWALFILIPVVVTVQTAARRAATVGRWDRAAVTTLVGGAFPLAVALIFFFGLSWAAVWPIFPVLAGLWLLAGAWSPERRG